MFKKVKISEKLMLMKNITFLYAPLGTKTQLGIISISTEKECSSNLSNIFRKARQVREYIGTTARAHIAMHYLNLILSEL